MSAPQPGPAPTATPNRDAPPSPPAADAAPRRGAGPRAQATPLYNQAINQTLPSGSQSSHKRTASARSPSPNTQQQQPNKARRMDLPTGPRAMHRDGGGGKSLLERMSGRSRNAHGRDEIQARIDAVTNQASPPPMGMNNFNNGMGGMMMPGNEMAAGGPPMGGIVNPLALQEIMMNQMALMAQMANSMGMLNQGQYMGSNGFQMMPGMAGAEGNHMNHQNDGRRGGPPKRGGGRGGTSAQWVAPHVKESPSTTSSTPSAQKPVPAPAATAPPATIAAPTPQPATTVTPAAEQAAARPGLVPPERPQSPTLCKFGLKCTNAVCRYSHPSPVATPESGVVLSNDPCEAGKNCKDKDCIKAHVSPAALNVQHVTG